MPWEENIELEVKYMGLTFVFSSILVWTVSLVYSVFMCVTIKSKNYPRACISTSVEVFDFWSQFKI